LAAERVSQDEKKAGVTRWSTPALMKRVVYDNHLGKIEALSHTQQGVKFRIGIEYPGDHGAIGQRYARHWANAVFYQYLFHSFTTIDVLDNKI
jgi:hypothetical protein